MPVLFILFAVAGASIFLQLWLAMAAVVIAVWLVWRLISWPFREASPHRPVLLTDQMIEPGFEMPTVFANPHRVIRVCRYERYTEIEVEEVAWTIDSHALRPGIRLDRRDRW